MALRRTWSPPKQSAHALNPTPSLAQYAGAPEPGAWSANPKDHITIWKPRCGTPGCRELAMTWGRCRCTTTFARCHQHQPTDPVAALRRAHEVTCPATSA